MASPFNVLISSLSKKIPLVREIRKAVVRMDPNGKIFGGDSDMDCIGRYWVNKFWHMPLLSDLDPDDVVRFCRINHVRAIIPTRDGELAFYAQNRDRFEAAGISVMVSSAAGVRACIDKKAFYQTIRELPDVRVIPVADHPNNEIGKRWVVKERYGSGSSRVITDVTADKALAASSRFEAPIFQPFIEGTEYSIDVYVDRRATPKGCVVRTRDIVNHGESQMTTTIARKDIADACLAAAGTLGITGHMVFQAIEDRFGLVHLMECNSRFGGASTLSIAAGLDSFYWFFRECIGDDLHDVDFAESPGGLRQVRYASDKIVSVV